jgi:hypothetical protein
VLSFQLAPRAGDAGERLTAVLAGAGPGCKDELSQS